MFELPPPSISVTSAFAMAFDKSNDSRRFSPSTVFFYSSTPWASGTIFGAEKNKLFELPEKKQPTAISEFLVFLIRVLSSWVVTNGLHN